MLSHMMDSAFLCYSANSVLKFVVINCLYSSFRLIGRNDMSINSFRSGWAFWNRLNRLAIVLVSMPDDSIALMKSFLLIFRFLPFRFSANSSVSVGSTSLVSTSLVDNKS